ncbi:MAG TPA: ABC transporter permease [Vicinamibacterales bacterium]|nr:ABC transporter permease [Vicinamibacterales bacterium]
MPANVLDQLWQDIRYGSRMLLANPAFTIVAVISLALGIGANCAIFTWTDALLLRPLPVARPGEVLTVGSTVSVQGFTSIITSYPDYVDVRDQNKSFEGLAAFTFLPAGVARTPDELPKLRMGMAVSGNLFGLMSVQPDLGRGFAAEEDRVPERDAVVVLGRDLWEKQFESDREVLGRRVRINGIEFTIIGVAPAEFTGLNQYVRSDFYVPLMMWPRLIGLVEAPAAAADSARRSDTPGSSQKVRPLEARDFRQLTVKGRLKAGISMAQAQSELSVIASSLERMHPDTNKNTGLVVRTELQTRISQSPPDAMLIAMLTTLAAAVLFVACANVAGLLTSRAPARAREMALRLSIGAGRVRIVRQLVTESLLVSLLGGALGVAIGYGGVKLFRSIQLPTDLPVSLNFQLDRRALTFCLIVAVVSAVLFSLIPAIQASRTDLTGVMKATDAVARGRRRWGRNLLVGGQVAVSVVLLVLGAFMYRAFDEQLSSGPGYKTDHLVMMSFDPGLVRYTEPQALQFFEQVAERARAVPGVKTAALTSTVPMQNDSITTFTIVPEGFQFPVGKDNVTVFGSTIDEHYFDTMGLSMTSGRGFRATDTADAPRVAIVNEQLAKHYWPGKDPIGRRFRLNDGNGPWVEVVGLAKTSKYLFLAEAPTEFVYLPYKQKFAPRMILVSESHGDSASLVTPLRQVVRELDASQPVYNVRTMEEFYRMRTTDIFTMILRMVGALATMGLTLAVVGLYGLVAYAANRRTKEIGIRMAIGAGRASVLRMILRQGLTLAIVGLVLGLVAGAGADRLLNAMFPSGDTRSDPMALVLVVPIVLAVTFIAVYVPARRASRIHPMEALRYE